MPTKLFLETPANFSFRHTVYSHGWSELLPFRLDAENWRLEYVFAGPVAPKPVSAAIYEVPGGLEIDVAGKKFDEGKLMDNVRHIFRLDDPLDDFYILTDNEDRLKWVSVSKAGRLIRSRTVFEDLVKTMCTTNCSWGLTKNMVRNLVENLGERGVGGNRAFPTPQAMASVPEKFYRDDIRSGYRSPYFVELAEKVASGTIDPELWLTSELPTPELKKEIKNVKGCGDYAADNLLKLLGRYNGLALDSWLRSQFYKKHNREKVCPDKKIERHYTKFGEWKGLAIWCDMTERWFDEKLMN
ncbi:MAG: Fe-S cluster assembly protein HesB [Pyrinomonadaceae bacterium]